MQAGLKWAPESFPIGDLMMRVAVAPMASQNRAWQAAAWGISFTADELGFNQKDREGAG